MRKVCIFLFVLCCASGYGQRTAVPGSAAFQVNTNCKGFLPPRMSNLEAIAEPASGLLACSTTKNCLALFNTKWNCAKAKGDSLSPIDFPVMTGEEINSIPDEEKEPGKTIYDSDKKCLRVCNGHHCPCTKHLGGPWFSKDSYPLWGAIAANGEVISSSGGFSVEKIGTGVYKVILEGGTSRDQVLLSVTGNIFSNLETYEDSRAWSGGYNPLDGLAISKGRRLPDASKRLYAMGGWLVKMVMPFQVRVFRSIGSAKACIA